MTGNTPGMPMQMGQVAELGGNPNCVLQPQNNFVRVSSCTWTSRPMTVRPDFEYINHAIFLFHSEMYCEWLHPRDADVPGTRLTLGLGVELKQAVEGVRG
jgi:hypothetical protein